MYNPRITRENVAQIFRVGDYKKGKQWFGITRQIGTPYPIHVGVKMFNEEKTYKVERFEIVLKNGIIKEKGQI